MKTTALIVLLFFISTSFLIQQSEMKAYAWQIYTAPEQPALPLATDLSTPDFHIKYSWARMAGRSDLILMNIPSNQASTRIMLPSGPSSTLVARYDPASSTATIALMRMQAVGPNIRAELLQLTPKNIHHPNMQASFYNFSWLEWNSGACGTSPAQLSSSGGVEGINHAELIRDFITYDQGRSNTQPYLSLTPSQQAAINTNNYYWYQRLNTSPCWKHTSLQGFDTGDGDWHNVSYAGLYNITSFLLSAERCAAAFIVVPNIRQAVDIQTHSNFFTKTVKETVNYFLKPTWTVGTHANSGTVCEIFANPSHVSPTNDTCFTSVNSRGAGFPSDEILLYSYSQTQTGLTGLFAFVAITVIAALGVVTAEAGGLEMGASLEAMLVGGGAIGGLAASGFNPTTSTTASITPFYDSSYSLNPAPSSGDAAIVQQKTDSQWLNVDLLSVPGLSGAWIGEIDYRRALSAGGASHAAGYNGPIVSEIGMDDQRFPSVYREMFGNDTRMLQQYKYPFTKP